MHQQLSRAKRRALPFDLTPVMPDLFRLPAWPAKDLPAFRAAWERAHQHGVAAAVNHDHHLFAHRPGCFDPAWEGEIYTDAAALSPWTPDNVYEQLPDLDDVEVRALTPTVWLLEQSSYCERSSRLPAANWEVVFPSLLNDPARTAFWASAMIEQACFFTTALTAGPAPRDGTGAQSASTQRPGLRLRMGIRQTPLGIFSLVLVSPAQAELDVAQQWIAARLPRLIRRLATHGRRYDYPSEHRRYAAPLMLQVDRQWRRFDGSNVLTN